MCNGVACVVTADGGNSEPGTIQRSARCVAEPRGHRLLL